MYPAWTIYWILVKTSKKPLVFWSVGKKVPAHIKENSAILAKENKNVKSLESQIVINMLKNMPFKKCGHISERICMLEVKQRAINTAFASLRCSDLWMTWWLSYCFRDMEHIRLKISKAQNEIAWAASVLQWSKDKLHQDCVCQSLSKGTCGRSLDSPTLNLRSPLSCHTERLHQPCAGPSYITQGVAWRDQSPTFQTENRGREFRNLNADMGHTNSQGKLRQPYQRNTRTAVSLLYAAFHNQNPAVLSGEVRRGCLWASYSLQREHHAQGTSRESPQVCPFYFLNWSENTESLLTCF